MNILSSDHQSHDPSEIIQPAKETFLIIIKE